MLSTDYQAAIDNAANEQTPQLERQRFREIHREAELAAQAVLDAHPETRGRTLEARSRKAHEHRPEMNGIHWRILSAAIASPELLALPRTKMLAELSEQFGFPIKRHILTNSLKRRNGYDRDWLVADIVRKLETIGHTGFRSAELKSVETIIKVLANRLLPSPDCEVFTVRIAFTANSVIIGKREYLLHSTASGRPRIGRGNHKLPADTLLALLIEATGKGGAGAQRKQRSDSATDTPT